MKVSLDTVKIEMTIDESLKFKIELQKLLAEIKHLSNMIGQFDEAYIRETYPKINEFLNVINIGNDVMPF